MEEPEIQSKMPEWARRKVVPEDRGADFALEFLGMWNRTNGSDAERNAATRQLIEELVGSESEAVRAVREAGIKLAEQLLAKARAELAK